MEKVAKITDETIEDLEMEPYTLRFSLMNVQLSTHHYNYKMCFRMLQGAFLVYAIGVVFGVFSIVMEVKLIKGNLRKEAWKAVMHVKSIRG